MQICAAGSSYWLTDLRRGQEKQGVGSFRERTLLPYYSNTIVPLYGRRKNFASQSFLLVRAVALHVAC